MDQPDKITAKNLGYLAIEDQCLADFWWLSHMRFRPALSNFGAAIFNDCQSIQEAMLGYYLEKDGCLPKQFAPFCDIKERVNVNKHWAKFGYLHKSGVWLYGSPDEVVRRADDRFAILDHKTAHPKHDMTEQPAKSGSVAKAKDRFAPMYEIQIAGYTLIGDEGLGLGRPSPGALLYWDMQNKAVIENPAKFIRDGMVWAAFSPVIFEVDIDYSRIDKLLKEALKIWKSKVPPEGRENCKECKKLAATFAIQCEVENALSVRDHTALTMSGNDPWVFQRVVQRFHDRASFRLSALYELREASEPLELETDGIAAHWEFFE